MSSSHWIDKFHQIKVTTNREGDDEDPKKERELKNTCGGKSLKPRKILEVKRPLAQTVEGNSQASTDELPHVTSISSSPSSSPIPSPALHRPPSPPSLPSNVSVDTICKSILPPITPYSSRVKTQFSTSILTSP